MIRLNDNASSPHPADDARLSSPKSLVNLPNLICILRMVLAVIMVVLAYQSNLSGFIAALVLALLSDWADGKLARMLDQETAFGSRLDSVADTAMYLALLVGAAFLKEAVIVRELPWIICALISWGGSVIIAQRKFGRWPSYHTWSAKLAWWLVAIGVVLAFSGWSVWPLRIAMIAVCASNFESMTLTCILDEPAVNVPTVFHGWARRTKQQKFIDDRNDP